MIRYLESKNLINKYAFVVEPTEKEKRELVEKGYTFYSRAVIQTKDSLDYGKIEEIWIK